MCGTVECTQGTGTQQLAEDWTNVVQALGGVCSAMLIMRSSQISQRDTTHRQLRTTLINSSKQYDRHCSATEIKSKVNVWTIQNVTQLTKVHREYSYWLLKSTHHCCHCKLALSAASIAQPPRISSYVTSATY